MKKSLLLASLLAVTALAQAESATYTLDANHTYASFEIKHFGTSTLRGRWDKKEGSITLDKAAKTGRVEVTLDMSSISTGSAKFDGHLKSDDFFAVEKNPKATFVGDKFTFGADGKVTAVAGQLTMLGKSNPVTLTATHFNCFDHPMLKREVCGGDFEATIQRSQWGMNYGIPFSSDNVRILVEVEGVKQ